MTMLREPPPRRPIEKVAPLVEVLELERAPARFAIHSQGTVRPRTETVVSAEVSGTIIDISPSMVAGGVFEPSEVLLRIDPTNYEVAVDQAEALVKQRKIEFEGAEKLRNQGYRAESEYASAAAALASARAELVRARRNLERTFIRLPYAGMVRSKEADLGQFVNPGTRLGVVFATDYAEVRLPLTDQDLAFLELPAATDMREGAESNGPEVILSANRKGRPAEWTARIVRTEGVVDESSRQTYAVAGIRDPYRLEGDGEPLPMGTFVSAAIQGGVEGEVIRVPRVALRGPNELVFVGDDNRINLRTVNVIRTDTDYAYLQGGVSPGERICLTPIESPINGMVVRTTDRQAESVLPGDGPAIDRPAAGGRP
jgi:RND family efflux transporter MFP subunit